jgi:Na+/proline symporter
MISGYDYFIIGFYLAFLIVIGMVFRRMSKDTSDFFRAGGAMPWWITGTSAWIFSYTAWTFTGAAAKVYETGTLVLAVFYSTIIGLVIALLWTCKRFRRLRVITWMEAVRHRYGAGAEQFYIWIKLPQLLIFSGITLNAIGVFMAAVFHVNISAVLIVLGSVVTLLAFAGGSWAVLASDFVQALLVVTITISTAVMVLRRPEIGGLSGLIHRVPSSQFHWTALARPEFLIMWILANLWFKFSDENSMERSPAYLMSRSDHDARLTAVIPLIGTLIGPLVWFIPAMAATILHPNLAAEYPLLKQPHEAAFVAVARDVMPTGLIGLLICAMLGATVTAMNTGLNRNVGITIRSLYMPLFFPDASEKHLLTAGKICTLLYGAIIIFFAWLINAYRTMGLFDLANQFAASVIMPLALPLIYGLFYKRTPGWSAWSTALVAGISSYLLGRFIKPEMFTHLMGWTQPLTHDESTDFLLAVTTFGAVGIGTAWYFFTSLFYRYASAEEHDRIQTFFTNLDTPVDKHGVEGVQTSVYKLLGALCLVYGAVILLFTLIPNSLSGRLCFVFCGGTIFGIGAVLFAVSRQPVPSQAAMQTINHSVGIQPEVKGEN